jgi:hypothetical protein
MTSLAEAYDQHAGEVSRERLYLGTGLFGAGALLAVLGIVLGTTGILPALGFSLGETIETAAVLVGLGVPAVFVGIFTVLPASRTQRAAAAIGASLAVLGVMLFRAVYWEGWYGASGMPTTATVGVIVVYFAGTITTFWCLFVAVATFKRRNDPGGTVTLTLTEGGRTRTVEVAEDSVEEARAAFGGVGVFGGVDDPADDRPETPNSGSSTTGTGSAGPAATPGAAATSDGGAAASNDISSPLDDDSELVDEPAPSQPADHYCGNCTHFEYVRTDQGFQPYCGFHDDLMDDMEACEQWQPNR